MSVEELVKELRQVAAFPRPIHKAPALMEHAADKLEELAAALAEKDKEIAALREALQPFAHFSHVFEAGIGNYPREDHQEFYRVATMKLGERTLTVGDFRRARNAGGKYAE